MVSLSPEKIYEESYRLIRESLGTKEAFPGELEIRMRIAHANADVELAKAFIFHPDSIKAGIRAILRNKNIVTDVRMLKAGILGRRRQQERYKGHVYCFLNHSDVEAEALAKGTTKAAIAIRKAVPFFENGIVAIGNAPTALFELCDLIKRGIARPALVIGVPVGFVGALDSKIELTGVSVPFITNMDKRGGSPTAAAIVNGIIYLASQTKL